MGFSILNATNRAQPARLEGGIDSVSYSREVVSHI